jgi:hypothetical protein
MPQNGSQRLAAEIGDHAIDGKLSAPQVHPALRPMTRLGTPEPILAHRRDRCLVKTAPYRKFRKISPPSREPFVTERSDRL